MKTSETVQKIAAALLTAQRAITFASKDATNPHFKNKYADLPAVIDAIKPALNDAGIVFVQTFSPSDTGSLALTTRLLHESGEWMEDTATIPLPKNDPQGYGSAATYGRRYALAAITGLYQDDDDGVAAMKPAAVKPVTKKPVVDVDGVITAMRECDDLDSLKEIFAAAWGKATTEQQPQIKKPYDQFKAALTTKEPA